MTLEIRAVNNDGLVFDSIVFESLEMQLTGKEYLLIGRTSTTENIVLHRDISIGVSSIEFLFLSSKDRLLDEVQSII